MSVNNSIKLSSGKGRNSSKCVLNVHNMKTTRYSGSAGLVSKKNDIFDFRPEITVGLNCYIDPIKFYLRMQNQGMADHNEIPCRKTCR